MNNRKLQTRTRRHSIIRGFTLTELIIYIFISALVMGTMLVSFHFFRKNYYRTAASYDIQKEIPVAVDWLKRDLMSTSLNSIRVYPTTNAPGETSGMSFITAMQPDAGNTGNPNTRFQLNPAGTPQWSAYVFYTLVPNPPFQGSTNQTPRSASLVRWEMKLTAPQAVPMPTNILPSAYTANAATPRVIVKDLLLPGSPPVPGFDPLKINNQDYGGFRVTFVSKDTALNQNLGLSNVNPSLVSDSAGGGGSPATSKNTELVQVDLIALQVSSTTGQPSAYSVGFQVKPRN